MVSVVAGFDLKHYRRIFHLWRPSFWTGRNACFWQLEANPARAKNEPILGGKVRCAYLPKDSAQSASSDLEHTKEDRAREEGVCGKVRLLGWKAHGEGNRYGEREWHPNHCLGGKHLTYNVTHQLRRGAPSAACAR